ncbi:MAG: glutamine--fructose-6-phosphate transaminase (isomerizing) [Candidatus Sumerlaeota bacterium]|nr:glutamine--fructose-6-phosphate transaminase (isomerizing) [Candidatus Sumerlaeota bacterium]
MCGIMGVVSRRNITPMLLEGLKRLEYRGYDSAGIAVLRDGAFQCEKVVGRVNQLEAFVSDPKNECAIGIAHTRWATHGAPSVRNAHPHFDENHRIALVHNGIIENYAALKELLVKKGRKIVSETDSELIAHLIAEYMNGNLMAAIQKALAHLEGTFGLLILSRDDPHRMIAARRGSPVVIGIGEGEYYVASDVSAFAQYTRQVVYLSDGEMAELTPTGYRTMTFDDVTLVRETDKVTWEIDAIEKGGYEHFMLKEIFEQPAALRNTLAGRVRAEEGRARLGGITIPDEELRSLQRIVISGCGTAWHAGLVGEYMIEELARIPTEVEYASEFRYRNPILGARDLAIFISQSGETADTLAAMREAKAKGSRVMGICNVVGSTIARESGMGAYTHAGPEIGVASTKAFTTQMAALAIFALQLGRLRDLSPEEFAALLEDLSHVPQLMETVLKTDAAVKELVPLFMKNNNCLYLGRGINFPIALEGALKLKEISYIHAEGYPAAEMKHGPIALIEKDMPVVVIAVQDPTYEKVISNIEEIRARQGCVIAIATEGDIRILNVANHVIYVPPIKPILTPFLTVIPLQLLAYHIAAAKGCDIDKPRNLAKSVTVE